MPNLALTADGTAWCPHCQEYTASFDQEAHWNIIQTCDVNTRPDTVGFDMTWDGVDWDRARWDHHIRWYYACCGEEITDPILNDMLTAIDNKSNLERKENA